MIFCLLFLLQNYKYLLHNMFKLIIFFVKNNLWKGNILFKINDYGDIKIKSFLLVLLSHYHTTLIINTLSVIAGDSR